MEGFAERAGLALFKKHIQAYEPADPMYETYVDKRGRTKRRRRSIPPGLSARDAKILHKVQRRAHYLDKGMNIAGFRVGWTFWIGLVPFAGDVADAGLNYLLVVQKARQAEIPEWLLGRMLINNAISAGLGFVPIVGDVALATFKANSRNAALLEEFLRVRGAEFIKVSGNAAVQPGAGVLPGEHVEGKHRGFFSTFRKPAGTTHGAPAALPPAPATSTVAASRVPPPPPVTVPRKN